MRDALNATGRPMVVSINGFNMSVASDAGDVANSWRTTPDDDHFLITNLAPRIFKNDEYQKLARPGRFNDPDVSEGDG